MCPELTLKKRSAYRLRGTFALVTLPLALLVTPVDRVGAQSVASRDARDDAAQARTDAIFATPYARYPAPYNNMFATTSGLEQQARRSEFTFAVLAPISYNSNPLAAPADSAATPSAEFSPWAGLSWSAPLFDLPVRMSATVFAEMDRFTQAKAFGANFDKLGGNIRLQYVDLTNDQNYSPYIAFAPRLDFDPTFAERFSTRYDLNLGFNKIFNFDRNFQRVAFSGNSQEATVWSFGLTTFLQQRWREPSPSSFAFFILPSVSYVIAPNWNVSLGVDFMRRGFESAGGFAREDVLLEPIATLEFIVPSAWLGGDVVAGLLGRPALDFQVAYEREWSNLPGASFAAWHVGAILKMGWRF